MNRLITFSQLHEISNENKDKLNRSIWTEKLLEEKPDIKNQVLPCQFVMEHHHAFGEPVETHIRTMVFHGNEVMYQDMTKEQWNSLEYWYDS